MTYIKHLFVGASTCILLTLGGTLTSHALGQKVPPDRFAIDAAEDVGALVLDRAVVPVGLANGQESMDREQAAITEIQKTLSVSFRVPSFGEIHLPGAKHICNDRRTAPVLLAPDPDNMRRWLAAMQPGVRPEGVYDTSYSPQDFIPGASPGTKSGESVLFRPVHNPGPSGFKASKPWGIDEAEWDVYVRVEQAGRFTHRLADLQMSKQPSLSPVGVIRTWLGTDRVWGYAVWDNRFPEPEPERGWLYALAEANSLPRIDDPLAEIRLSPSTNHVDTSLATSGWPEIVPPYIGPRPYKRTQDEDRTEAIAVTSNLL